MLETSSGVAQLSQRLRRTESDMSDDSTLTIPLTKEIPLTQGKVATVDAEDYERLSRYSWAAAKVPNSDLYYAIRTVRRNGKKTTEAMHRMILAAPKGMEVDHRDCDGLNNRRNNLRLATGSQNRRNRRPIKGGESGYKGVWQCEGRWGASITKDNKKLHLGLYLTAEDAARAYDVSAKKLHGEFARINFPDSGLIVPTRGTRTNPTSSKYRGVSYDKARKQWQVSIYANGRRVYSARFKVERDAAVAYDAKAKELFGEAARLNFP